MYENFYGLDERPFSITPDPRFVYLSARHQDALAHLLYGVGRGGSGGFVQLTGEVGTGKTTLCRLMLEQVPEDTRVALILNPMLEPRELLRAICREFGVPVAQADDPESLGQALNQRLLEIHAAGNRAVLIVDEAQNMSRETLEQVRLLTNLETSTDKLLQIILLGQPELREILARPSLRQLAQRITARYHLAPLQADETADYVRHRLRIAGAPRCPFTRPALKALHRASAGVPRLINIIADRSLMAGYARESEQISPARLRIAGAPRCPFTRPALKALHRASAGVPRLINIIADRSLMAGYARESEQISPALVRQAAVEVVGQERVGGWRAPGPILAVLAVSVVVGIGAWTLWTLVTLPDQTPVAEQPRPLWRQQLDQLEGGTAWSEIATLLPGASGAEIAEACGDRAADGLICARLRGNWSLLRRLARPAVLLLADPPQARLLTLAVDETHAQVRHRGQDFGVPLHALDENWLGDFLLIWRDDGQVWQQGDNDARVAEFKRLAARDPVAPWQGGLTAQYGPEFAAWVRGFQRRNGLREDGMAGPVTRLFLMTFAEQPAAPVGR